MGDKESQKSEAKIEQKRTLMNALSFATDFGFIIALPLIGLGFLGKWLDARLHTKYITLLSILLAITLSTIWMTRKIKTILADLKNKS